MLRSAKDGVELGSKAYIGFRVSAEMCLLDTAEGLARTGAKNTRDTYVSTNLRSQQWQIVASVRVIVSISVALHC